MTLAEILEHHLDAHVETITELQHAEPGEGPWQIYIFNASGYHSGGVWFRKGPMQYPDEEITWEEARKRSDEAIAQRHEVRVVDGGDKLVFHFHRAILHGAGFWGEF